MCQKHPPSPSDTYMYASGEYQLGWNTRNASLHVCCSIAKHANRDNDNDNDNDSDEGIICVCSFATLVICMASTTFLTVCI